jgi:glutathione S-transferase
MAIVLYHYPFSRARNAVWMLEELETPYELRWVDLGANAQKSPEILALNPMGKLPILVDGEAVVTEGAAIALYLADRYAAGRLAPRLDDPARGAYLRWTLFAPSVIEPGTMAKAANWVVRESQAGWGGHEAMLATMEHALSGKQYLLGDQFSMADVVFGGTLRYMLALKMVEPRPVFTAYAERLGARPAFQRAEARNAAVAKEHGLEGR